MPIEKQSVLCYTDNMAQTATQRQYQDYLQSARWRMIRATRRMVDGSRCRNCGYNRRLEIHHKTYRNRGRGGVTGAFMELCDCVTLCHDCHQKAHGR